MDLTNANISYRLNLFLYLVLIERTISMKRMLFIISPFLLIVLLFGCNPNQNENSNVNETSSENGNNTNDNETSSNNGNNTNDTKEPELQALKIEDYFPIKENTHYIYQGMGNEYAAYDVYIDYTSDDKVQQRINNGGTEIVKVLERKRGKLTKLYSRPETYYRENLLKSKGEEEILLMEPLKKGTSWKLKDSRVRTITDTAAEIKTPLGTYKTIEVTTKSADDKTMDYYAKDIGLVKTVFINEETKDEQISSTLSKIEENRPFVQSANFYYPNIDDGKYYYESKEISYKTNDLTKKKLGEAYKEPINQEVGRVFSENTKINSLYLNKDNNVYLDLNQAFVTEMNAGSQYEAMILQSIVNTFGQYYNAEKVYLTINNKPYESGHIAMKKGEFFKVNVNDAVEIK